MCHWHITEEQRRNSLKMGLPEGPEPFWAATVSLIICVALLRNNLCSLSRSKIISGKWSSLFFSDPLLLQIFCNLDKTDSRGEICISSFLTSRI